MYPIEFRNSRIFACKKWQQGMMSQETVTRNPTAWERLGNPSIPTAGPTHRAPGPSHHTDKTGGNGGVNVHLENSFVIFGLCHIYVTFLNISEKNYRSEILLSKREPSNGLFLPG